MPSAAGAAPAPSRIFLGWWMVAVSIVGMSFSTGAVLVYTFGVFAKPLAQAFHSNRSSIALAVSLLDLMMPFAAPAAGRLVDRYGARGIIVGSLVALSACLAALSFVQPPLWHLYVLYMLAGTLGVATTPVTYSRVIANWFDRTRGLALGLASAGVGLGAFIAPSLAQYLIDLKDWRLAYMGLAAGALFLAMPVVAIFLRTSPEDVGLLQDDASEPASAVARAAAAGSITVSDALRTRTFWLLCGIFFCVAACVNGTISHITPLLTDRGESGRLAAFATSLFGIATMVGRVLNGYLVDRFFAPRIAAILFSGAAVGVALLLMGVTGKGAFAAALLLGFAMGAEADVMPFLISRYFGMHSMGEIYGCMFGVYTLGNASGRYLFAVGFDSTASYRIPLLCALTVLVLTVFVTLKLPKYSAFETRSP
jgi:predicted MFS family arabinose efflux permease